jgi:hypothetical protein
LRNFKRFAGKEFSAVAYLVKDGDALRVSGFQGIK